ncbi:MAG: ribulose-phosphate 3-epimerase [Ignavibacteriales bacterium]|nr:ribulose-phosphate 3-epimerase [Ignavibacteriales bacterium]
MNKLYIAPSVLAADFSNLGEQISLAEAGGADWIHLDIMDGRFVPNITFGPMVVSAIRKMTKLPLDTHLMIADADKHLEAFREAGSDRITVHQEACPHLQRTVARIRELGAKPGVAINPATPSSTLTEIMADTERVLVMTVNPGFGGQRFLPGTLKKMREIKAMIKASGRDIRLEVDGGVDASTMPLVTAAGADTLVAGTSVFRTTDIRRAIAELRAAGKPKKGTK